jgi:hypothetical protein
LKITLSQILDVYLALSHNDNVTDVEPLYCSLSSRRSLSSQYAYLQSAARERKTFVQISKEFVSHSDDLSAEIGSDKQEQYHNTDASDISQPKDSNNDGLIEFGDTNETTGSGDEETSTKSEERDLVSKSTVVGNVVAAESEVQEFEEGEVQVQEEEYRPRDMNSLTVGKPTEDDGFSESTVKEDQSGVEGEHESHLDLGVQPEISSILSPTNVNADPAITISETDDPETSDHPDHKGPQSADTSGVIQSSSTPVPPGTQQAGNESYLPGSASSQTLKLEQEEEEEDLFSQANDQTLVDENGGPANDQSDEEEDFELEEPGNQDEGSVVGRESGEVLDPEAEFEEMDLERVVAADQFPSKHGEEPSKQDDEDVRDLGDCDDDDEYELLNFEAEAGSSAKADDSAERSEHKKEPSTPSRLSKIPNNQPNASNALETREEALDHADSDSLREKAESNHSQSSAAPVNSDRSIQREGEAQYAPSTPPGGLNGSKRKATEENDDDDEFDLFSTETPDKKRGKPS